MKGSLLFIVVLLCTAAPAQDNLIKNGDFNDSTGSNVWIFNSNGAQATGKIEGSKFIIATSSPGSRESAPQLMQQNISLTESEGYSLKFKVSANDTGFIKVILAGDGNTIFSDTMAGRVAVSATGKTYTQDIFVQRSTTNARLLFNCGLSRNLIRIAVDSVSLVKKSEPIISIVDPSVNVRWITGTERQISWKNSGVLDQIKILVSSDSGKTWSVVVAAATNQKNYWWNVPSSAAGENCRIIVSNISGTVADTSSIFKILAAGAVDAGEMVKNGDFSDTTGWRLSVIGPAKAEGKITDGQYVLTIDTIENQPWQVKLEQDGLTLQEGKMYRLSFDAYASKNFEIFANVGGVNGNPAWSVSGSDSIPVNITTTKTHFFRTMVMKFATSSDIRIEFNCGTDVGKVYFDNVSMVEMDSMDVFVFKPFSGDILKAGSRFNIEWLALGAPAITLEYSADSGATWDSIAKNIDNLGAYSWTVPDKSSEKCFIRIKNAAKDSVLGTSGKFQVNKFGVAIRTGELITNGRFTKKLQNWTTDFKGSKGQANVTSTEMYELSVTEPGSSLGAIVLSQDGLPMLGGKSYTLSFDAFANGNRSIEVKVFAEGDSLPILDSTVALPTVKGEISFNVTADKDALVKLALCMGGSRANVFLDNISFYTGPKPVVGAFAPASQQKCAAVTLAVRSSSKGITFIIGKRADGVIGIYDLRGSLVRNLIASGNVRWDGKDMHGAAVSRGAYVAVLHSGAVRTARQFVVK